MAYRYRSRQIIDGNAPTAAGECDRCGFVYALNELQWQYDWAGASIIRLNLRVCPTCMDPLTPAHKTTFVGPDPLPVQDARPIIDVNFETDYRSTDGGDTRTTDNGNTRVVDGNS